MILSKIILFALAVASATSFELELDQLPTYHRHLQNSARGSYRNFIVDWEVFQFEENLVNMAVTIGITLDSGRLSILSIPIMGDDFGTVIRSSVEVEFLQEDLRRSQDINITTFSRRGDSFEAVVDFGDGISTRNGLDFDFRISYLVENTICVREGEIGISATWGGFFGSSPEAVEYILTVFYPDPEDIEFSFRPRTTESSTFIDQNTSAQLSLPYSPDRLDMADDSAYNEEVFFTWYPNEFENSGLDFPECPQTDFNFVPLYFVAIVPLVACVCFGALTVAQRFQNQLQGNAHLDTRSARNLRRYFRGNRDILLVPDGERQVATVRAVRESIDETERFDELIPNSTFHVDLSGNDLGASGSSRQVQAAIQAAAAADSDSGEGIRVEVADDGASSRDEVVLRAESRRGNREDQDATPSL
eukprot:augustus_masked-scaffold_5-processed-gene-0.36-mRNA-1 protein AED:1.00 eAED:1.00 QI:0/-1/0/0/-1/1/1/0/418